ncbi:MAG: efflux RND transporter periplasmic adaptor subunit [Candidatus Cloacimonetes bacterium]|nr:efflux RND transporter periplasmic adaptor subunit [Candidatus Cloacimonadota bacterium]
MRRKRKWLIWGLIGLVVILVMVSRLNKTGSDREAPQQEQLTHTVSRGNIISKVEIVGEIQPQTVVAVKSKVSGTILRFYANENDYVKTGQIIADIEPDYNQANTLFTTKSRLQLAELTLNNARAELEKKRQLLAEKHISQAEYDQAADQLTTAQIEFRQATEQYELIRDLDTGGRVTHVYATASGVVIERRLSEGEMVQSSNTAFGEGTVVMRIADLSKMIVKTRINEVDIAKFALGQEARITVDALPYEEMSGRIIKIAPMAVMENNARVFPVEIGLDRQNTRLKPGMSANVSIIGESRNDVLIIPIRAVYTDDKNQDIVYVIPAGQVADTAVKPKAKDENSTPGTPTPVKLGSNDLQMVEVIDGLREGDVISLQAPDRSGMMFMGMN